MYYRKIPKICPSMYKPLQIYKAPEVITQNTAVPSVKI